MEELIRSLINSKSGDFIFNRSLTPSKALRTATQNVPNKAGVYLVFAPLNKSEGEKHLIYEIEGVKNELIYFGIAGGVTKNGRVIKQGLSRRINNVVSDGLKDIQRAKYWNLKMSERKISKLKIIYVLKENPRDLENIIYNALDTRFLKYPSLNKKLGR